MIVYSVHPEKVYQQMRKQGYFHGSLKYVWPEFKEPYAWMMAQMKKRLPDYDGVTYPVWVWKRRPNRNEKALVTPGRRGVILKLDIPEKEILWSSFNDWHCVLSDSPVTFDEQEWNEFEEEGFKADKMQQTWEKIFDFEWLSSRPEEWARKPDNMWIQGVVPCITIDQVKRVERFIAK
ncbi:DUF3841 domain-containing protein [Priestia megaterium]|nr:DUF3841 domain-containing protein [Priestia megaterium]